MSENLLVSAAATEVSQWMRVEAEVWGGVDGKDQEANTQGGVSIESSGGTVEVGAVPIRY